MQTIPLKQIFPNPDQPRNHFCPKKLDELALSIRENGLLEPIVATRRNGKYMIIAGERRYRACKLAGLQKVPLRVLEADDKKVAELALLENLQREDLNLIEEAQGYQRLMDLGMSMEEVAQKMGFKQTWRIRERLELLRLHPTFQSRLVEKHLTPSQAYELSRLPQDKQYLLYEKISQGKADTYNKLRALASALLSPPPQQMVFGGELSIGELSIGKKYDALVDRVLGFISRSFDKDDLKVLAKVTQSTKAVNIQKIDLIIGELKKIQKAMIQAQAQKEAL